MSRLFGAFSLVLVFMTQAPAHAGDNCWKRFWVDFHRNNCWPEPFVYPDRVSVCEFTSMQVVQGWQMQSLLGDGHFEADGVTLTASGAVKVRAILTQNPPAHRTVFVERGWSDEVTARRLEAVQRVAIDYTRGGAPDVVVSDLRLIGTPAEYVNLVNNKFMSNLPVPTLPAQPTSSGVAP